MFIYLIAAFGFLFQGGDEKELQKLHTTAVSALQSKDYVAAKKAYQDILQMIQPPSSSGDKYEVDFPTYIDVILRLSDTCLALKEYDSGIKHLQKLNQQSYPESFLPQIELLLSRYEGATNQNEMAYIRLKKLQKVIPLEKWKGEDRSFFHSIEITLNDKYDALKNRAKRFFASGSYKEAALMFEELIHAITTGAYPNAEKENSLLFKKIKYQLAETYFYSAQAEKTIHLLDDKESLCPQELFLLARAYKEQNEYAKAIDHFKTYLDASENLEYYEEAIFEIGFSYFQCKNFEQAKHFFNKLSLKTSTTRTSIISALYLAKILYQEEDLKGSKIALLEIKKSLSPNDPLQCEVAYFLGKIAAANKEYVEAIDNFEKSLVDIPFPKEWGNSSLSQLGKCYAQLGKYDQAEKIFQNLSTMSSNESHLIDLGKVFLLKGEIEKGETFLLHHFTSFSIEGKIDTLLTLAESKKSYEERKNLLTCAMDSKFSEALSHPESFFAYGVNELKERHWDEALFAFEKAFKLFEKNDPKKAKKALVLQAEAQFLQKNYASALTLLEKEHSCEAFYLYARIAAESGNENEAIEKLKEQLIAFPDGKYSSDAMYLLGCLYFNKKNYEMAYENFLELEKKYPASNFAGDALFWAAFSIEKMCGDKKEALTLRTKCYKNYPTSHFASLAYFKLHSIEEYLEGEPCAIASLQLLPVLFPDSNYLAPAFYFLGEVESDEQKASSYYKQAIVSVDPQTAEKALLFFRYRAILELATLGLDPQAEDFLEAQQMELSNETNPFYSPYSTLMQECQLIHAELCFKKGEIGVAKKRLLDMLATFKKHSILEGYYLAHAWEKMGKLAFSQKEYEAATVCFDTALECGAQHLHGEEVLALHLQQSDCYRKQNKSECAMRLLSKVINEDIASPLRIKAMYLRSEIYEDEKRYELAIRQLEATSKKGGEWGEKAKMKLKESYGIE